MEYFTHQSRKTHSSMWGATINTLIKLAATAGGWGGEAELELLLPTQERMSSISDDTIASIAVRHIVAVGRVYSGFNSKACRAGSNAGEPCKMIEF